MDSYSGLNEVLRIYMDVHPISMIASEKTGQANFKIDEISTCISLLMSMSFTIRINLKI